MKASRNLQVTISIKLLWKVKHPISSYLKFNRGKIYSYNNTCQKFEHWIKMLDFLSVHERMNEYDYYILLHLIDEIPI